MNNKYNLYKVAAIGTTIGTVGYSKYIDFNYIKEKENEVKELNGNLYNMNTLLESSKEELKLTREELNLSKAKVYLKEVLLSNIKIKEEGTLRVSFKDFFIMNEDFIDKIIKVLGLDPKEFIEEGKKIDEFYKGPEEIVKIKNCGYPRTFKKDPIKEKALSALRIILKSDKINNLDENVLDYLKMKFMYSFFKKHKYERTYILKREEMDELKNKLKSCELKGNPNIEMIKQTIVELDTYKEKYDAVLDKYKKSYDIVLADFKKYNGYVKDFTGNNEKYELYRNDTIRNEGHRAGLIRRGLVDLVPIEELEDFSNQLLLVRNILIEKLK